MTRDTKRTLKAGMTHPPRITDESVLSRWMGMELRKMNEGTVRERKTLAALLCEECPSAETKKGDPYFFDRDVLEELEKTLPAPLRIRLRLPVLFFLTPDVPDSCSCSDETAFLALQELGEISTLRTLEKGKFWVARAIVYAMVRKYPTAFQVVMGG
jgi:uncharacterized protein (UPF0216 family)